MRLNCKGVRIFPPHNYINLNIDDLERKIKILTKIKYIKLIYIYIYI